MCDREFYISYIRARLPYMTEQNLRMVKGFLDGLCGGSLARTSTAEHDRPVLTQEQQKQADQAANCMRSIFFSVCPHMGGEFCITHREDVTADSIGFLDDDVIVMDSKKIMEAWKQAGEKHIKRDMLLQYMEDAGYILPHKQRQAIIVNDDRWDAVCVPLRMLRPFIQDGYELRCVQEVLA